MPPRSMRGRPSGCRGRRSALQMPRSSIYKLPAACWRFPMILRRLAPFVLLLGLGSLTVAAQETRAVPTSPAQLTLSYAPVVKRVAPAVVNVYAAKIVENRNPLLDDPIFRRFFGVPGQQPEQMQRSLGSGVMVDPSGLVVTNNHVIEGADQVKISLSDKREFEAEIVL